MSAAQVAELRKSIKKAEASPKELGKLKKQAPSVERMSGMAKNGTDAARMRALAEILKRPTL
jgi:hypothetical protein